MFKNTLRHRVTHVIVMMLGDKTKLIYKKNLRRQTVCFKKYVRKTRFMVELQHETKKHSKMNSLSPVS